MMGSGSSGSSNGLFTTASMGGVIPRELGARLQSITQRSTPNLYRAGDQEVRFRGRAEYNRLRDSVRLIEAGTPDMYMHYRNDGGQFPSIRRAFTNAIRKHKRKLLIGGAVIGGAALLAGSIYGAVNTDLNYQRCHDHFLAKEPTETKKVTLHKDVQKAVKKETQAMQYEKPVGVFEKMSNNALSSNDYGGGGVGGGGGGSSGGGYGSFQQALQVRARRARKRRSKKSTAGKKTRRGKVTKRKSSKRRKKSAKHINKRAKKGRRQSKKKAF